METVHFGTAAAETLAQEATGVDAEPVFLTVLMLMVSGTLYRETGEIIDVDGGQWVN